MEADLLMYTRLDLLDYYRTPRTLSLRRLAVVLRHLPTDSATGRLAYGEYAEWASPLHWLLADIYHGWVGSPSPRLPGKQAEKQAKRAKAAAFRKRAKAFNERTGGD